MKIALIGYGKMGRLIEQIAVSRGHEITCIIDINNTEDILSDKFREADVAIEFTSPASAYSNITKAFEAGVKVVSGTTGWLDQHKAEIEEKCSNGNTLFWSSNFSIGVAVFNAVNKYLASIMNDLPQYDVDITETHHIHKLDAPSGTAITLAEGIISKLDRKTSWCKETAGDKSQIAIHSVREGEVPGIHTIDYESEADSITITHSAKNRTGFALGAVIAAEYTAQHSGLLGMNNLFNF